jgi:hypothetical protein
LGQRKAPKATHFIIIDACREELRLPILRALSAYKSYEKPGDTRGMFIGFSTGAGHTASDEGADGGPFARALASELLIPGQDQDVLFKQVRKKVMAITKDQRPWQSHDLINDVFLAGPSSDQPAQKEAKPAVPPAATPSLTKKEDVSPVAKNEAGAAGAVTPRNELDDPGAAKKKEDVSSVAKNEAGAAGAVTPRNELDEPGAAKKKEDVSSVAKNEAGAKSVVTPRNELDVSVVTPRNELDDLGAFRDNGSARLGSRAKWTSFYMNPAPGTPGAYFGGNSFGVVVRSLGNIDEFHANSALAKMCKTYPNVDFALLGSMNDETGNGGMQIEIGYNLTLTSAKALVKAAKDRRIAPDAFVRHYGGPAHPSNFKHCNDVEAKLLPPAPRISGVRTGQRPRNGAPVGARDRDWHRDPSYQPFCPC